MTQSGSIREGAIGARIFIALLCFVSSGCGNSSAPSEKGSTDASVPARPTVTSSDFVRGLVAEWPQRVDAHLARRHPLLAALNEQLAAPASRKRLDLKWAEVLKEAYAAEDAGPRFVGATGPTSLGQALQHALSQAADHALDAEKLGGARIAPRQSALSEASGRVEAAIVPRPGPPLVGGLQDLLSAGGIDTGNEEQATDVLLDRLARSPSADLQPIAKSLAARTAAWRAFQTERASMELVFADSYLRYAREMLRGAVLRKDWLQDRRAKRYEKALARARRKAKERRAEDPPVEMPEAPPAKRSIAELRKETLLEAFAALKSDSGAEAIASLAPPFEQYRGLLKELKRYRAIASSGGWKKVKSRARRLGRGSSKGVLKALERRLAREGLFAGEPDGKWDKELKAAIRAYQETHQLMKGDKLTRSFWGSLNVPVEKRIERIELTLRRWRESRIRGDEEYVFVNIPGFVAEVWSKGEKVFETGIVVGNREKRCDEEKKRQVYGYATPEQSAYISYIVFAPHWRVPPRIKREELDVDREKDPLFYEKEGYELVNRGERNESARQLPGPNNALGFVKIIFPNEHSVFLHDTTAKGLFQYPVRTFSHGCMRMEKPVEMARQLLSMTEQWDDKRFKELREKWDEVDFSPLKKSYDADQYEEMRKAAAALEESVILKRPIPIHVEYYTVAIDGKGRATFLSDPYKRDELRLNPKRAERCTPDSEVAQEDFGKTIPTVEKVEAAITALEPEAQRLIAATAGLSPEGGRKAKRALSAADSLGTALKQARTLTGQIREAHLELEEDLDEEGGTWNKRRTARAMKLKRMVDELNRMKKRVPKRLERLRSRLDAAGLSPGTKAAAPGDKGEGPAGPAPGGASPPSTTETTTP